MAITLLDVRTEGQRKAGDAVYNDFSKLFIGEPRPAALGTRASETQVNGIDLDFLQRLVFEPADGCHRLPKFRRSRMALGAVGGSVIKEIRRCCTRIEAEAVEGIGRNMTQGFVLHDQVTQAIKDWLAAVKLDAKDLAASGIPAHGKPRGGATA